MEKLLNSSTLQLLSEQSSSKSSFSVSSIDIACSSPVLLKLQSKFFPIQPRGGNLSERDIRNAGITPAAMSTESNSGSSPSSTVPIGKLKEPRDLYSTATLLHPIKWPVECQVIPEKIRHIESTPHKLEPFYSPSGKEPQPQPVGVEMGTVVYDYQPKLSVDYFCRATIGGSQDLEDYDCVHNASEPTALRFESRFESGNLAKAIKVTNTYYELYLRPDLYTDRHAQWFYFRIQNTKDGIQYRFSIVNFNKPDSLYRYGLKILMYSEKEAQLNNVGWTRCGQNIAYFKNDISPDENGPYYTLTFNLKFRHSNDTVYLAQCYPYTYFTLQNYLKSIEDDEFKSQLLTIRLLCRSLAGNNVHVLTVTSPDSQQSNISTATIVPQQATPSTPVVASASGVTNSEEEPATPNANKKPVIVISARVHPGETQSSYMMKGIIDFLTSDCTQAKELRDRFIFKLIPMLNPDGVIVGNSRCCLLGQDLNRQYRTVLREAFPQIYHAKVMLRRLQEENGIFLYCDLHGHSRRHNVFIYGCENRRMPERKLVEQVFPLMMHKNAADKFSFQNCKFKIQKNKEGTGRIFVWTLGIVNSYTLEISLGGSTMPSRQFTHFNTADYEACGRHFCETLLDYSDTTPLKENLRERILQKLCDEGSTADEPKNVILSDYSSLSHSETDGEDENEDDRDDDSSPETETTNTSSTSKTTSGVSSLSLPQSSSWNTLSSGKQLKRQMSIRKPHNSSLLQHKTKPAPAGRNSLKPCPGPTNENTRSPLPVHRATVDFTKIKQRKVDESVTFQIVPPPPSPNIEDNETDVPPTREISAAYKRLTKFRRKSRKNSASLLYVPSLDNADHLRHHSPQHYQLTAKCTRILFDDPFNPPGTRVQKPYIHRTSFRSTAMDAVDATDLNSGTEDECDPYDNMSAVKRFPTGTTTPTIRITDYGEPSSSSGINEDLYLLTGDMSKLKVSSSQQQYRSSSDSESQANHQAFPVFAPFVPSFPVGKAFLQTFYPGKPSSSPKGEDNQLTSSLSDTTLAASDVPSTSGNGKSGGAAGARRSSIGYLVSGNGTLPKGKLQATGSTILGSRESTSSSRRRVSWTGTLTVSVPTVPASAAIAVLKSPTTFSKFTNRKSFRKSKSLNDKPMLQGSQQRQSSTEMTDSTGSLIGSVSVDKICFAGAMGGRGNGKNDKSKFGSSSQPASSITAIGNVGMGSGSSVQTRKKRGKMKRAKNK